MTSTHTPASRTPRWASGAPRTPRKATTLRRVGTITDRHRTLLTHITSIGIAQPRLALKTGLATSILSTTLGELEAKKLIRRKKLPSDLRINLVTLTAKGVKAVMRTAAGY